MYARLASAHNASNGGKATGARNFVDSNCDELQLESALIESVSQLPAMAQKFADLREPCDLPARDVWDPASVARPSLHFDRNEASVDHSSLQFLGSSTIPSVSLRISRRRETIVAVVW